MILRRNIATVLWLVLGAGACTLLVRGTIDEYPEADGDGDSDADADGDGDIDAGVDAGADSGLDASVDACPGLDFPDATLESRCREFCRQQVVCAADAGLTDGLCQLGCRCYFNEVYEAEFARPYLECIIDEGCLTDDTSLTCTLEALPCVDHTEPEEHEFFLACQDTASDLGCGYSLGCGLVAGLQMGIAEWTECLDLGNCTAITTCRDEAIKAICDQR